MLSECELSVQAQTFSRWEHLILVDETREGCAATMNTLAGDAQGEWLVPHADDDLLLPGCLDTLLAYADHGEIIYSPPLVSGMPSEAFCQQPPVIPSFALINADLWRDIGGYDDEFPREEDRRFWIRALERGARFVRVDAGPTWIYRFHKGNKSMNGGHAS
jgi:hypothetical protein